MPTSISFRFFWPSAILFTIAFGSIAAEANETEIPGFTEAVQQIEVAASETGLLTQLNAKEGDYVEKGFLLGKLDDEIQRAQLEIASHLAESKGDLIRVESELKTKSSILDHFRRLSKEGYAQQKEILRAELEQEIAKANLLARKEKGVEYLKRMYLAKVQLARREIRSPISGRVLEKHRGVGEFVSVAQPKVVTIVQTHPIRGKFQIPLRDSEHFRAGEKVSVKVGSKRFPATVESIGLVATSETIPVCVTIENPDGFIKLGQKCKLVVPTGHLTSVED